MPVRLNADMPDQRSDPDAYAAERYRRRREGTWITRSESRGGPRRQLQGDGTSITLNQLGGQP